MTDVALQEQAVFHLTGRRSGDELEPVEAGDLRPALLAGYRDLTRLRHDYPVVLVDGTRAGEAVRSLSAVVNGLLQEVAPRGSEGERLRRAVLGLERELRLLVRDGAHGMLSDLWETAAAHVAGDDRGVAEELAAARARLAVDGELADCDGALPTRLVEHVWRLTQLRKAERFHAEVARLELALSDILRAAFVHSEGGSRPESLRAAVGDLHRDQFDFEVMSRLLGRGAPADELPAARRERIERALDVLRRQRFFEPPAGTELTRAAETPHAYRFTSCSEAREAFAERLGELVEFVRAMSVATLEAEGRYAAPLHDAFFEGFGEDALTADALALFPDYLVCLGPGADEAEAGPLMETLSSGLPVKVLVQVEDVLEEPSLAAGRLGIGMRGARLASAALGLHDVFVLQGTSSSLYRLRDAVERGLEHAGPALLSVYSGSAEPAGELPPYLTSAAALESRAFAAFTYDPAAGPDLASRFSLEGNPQPDADWARHDFEYAGPALERVRERAAFTIVDFAACDRRYAKHFARIPREQWNASLATVEEWLSLDPAEAGERIPHVNVVDGEDVLHKLIVDAALVEAARRCRERWHGLQELGGIHSSHAERALARERAAWEADKDRELEALRAEAATAVAVETREAPPADGEVEVAEQVEEAAVAAPSDDPWIETARCSSCNECTAINDRLFAYDENKQAYFEDLDAGTFREIVEAAEACQVAVIHPGKPRNPSEPGLEELIERAKPFQ